MDNLKFNFATPRDEATVKQFLEKNDLLDQDITPDGLKHFLIVRDGAEMIGLVGLEVRESCALLRSLAVNEKYRNRGCASLLVANIENYARSLKINRLYLLTMTAEEFFKKRGFQRTAREMAPTGIQSTAEFNDLCPASAAFMVKTIAAG